MRISCFIFGRVSDATFDKFLRTICKHSQCDNGDAGLRRVGRLNDAINSWSSDWLQVQTDALGPAAVAFAAVAFSRELILAFIAVTAESKFDGNADDVGRLVAHGDVAHGDDDGDRNGGGAVDELLIAVVFRVLTGEGKHAGSFVPESGNNNKNEIITSNRNNNNKIMINK